MSVKVMSYVLDYSQHKGSNLLTLLILADIARENGLAWPGIEYVAGKTRMSKRQTIRVLATLEASGELAVLRSKHGNLYWIMVWPPSGPDFFFCAKCGVIADDRPRNRAAILNEHHKIPKSEVGTDDPKNIEMLCEQCHDIAHDKPPRKSRSDKMSRDFRETFRVPNVTFKASGSDIAESPEPLEPPVKEPPLKSTAKKRKRSNSTPPAVELARRITHRYPPKKLHGSIDRTVGSSFGALLKWGRIVKRWILSGYNPTNYRGMLEVFRSGWLRAGQKASGLTPGMDALTRAHKNAGGRQ